MNATDHLDWLLTLKLPTGEANVGFGVSANVFPDILLEPLAKFFDPIPWLTVDGERYLPYSDWCEFLSKERKRFHLSMREESAELGRRGPSAEDLAKAPLLENWVVYLYGMTTFGLLGTPIGHPVRSSSLVNTSLVCAIDPGGTWARTVSRWYRLGKMVSAVELYALHGNKTVRFLPDIVDLHQAVSTIKNRVRIW